jgi:hypothetical protein
MASKQIGARMSGDDYQARFFWYMAAQLLLSDSNVERVNLEFDKAPHVDDVAVFYKLPGKSDWGRFTEVEFYQVKYHVDQRLAYTSDTLIDPLFIHSEKESLLLRFFNTYKALKDKYSWFTLNLVSNWIWGGDDAFAKSIRDNGALPDKFFTSPEGSVFGKVRRQWTDYLQTDAETFEDFAKRLRLKLNYFGNTALNDALSDRLRLAGLKPLDPYSMISPYDDLARKLVQSGTLELDKDTLLEICQRERLVQGHPVTRSTRTIGIRSFIRFAENLGIETDSFVCVADQFDGRFPREGSSWILATETIRGFIDSLLPQLSQVDHKILLDCHSSFAFLAGYQMTHRARVYPSGPRFGIELYKPSRKGTLATEHLWNSRLESVVDGAPNLAVVVSVANQAERQVIEYLEKSRKEVGRLLILEPISGTGATSIANADQAWCMACSLTQIVRRYQVCGQRTLIFISAPNFLTFFIGQQSQSLGRLTLFEYGMDNPEAMTYLESIELPFPKSL